jgi:uncharacterized membrane protein
MNTKVLAVPKSIPISFANMDVPLSFPPVLCESKIIDRVFLSIPEKRRKNPISPNIPIITAEPSFLNRNPK